MSAPDAPFGRAEPWPAPGKLNLFLHVVGRRDDGYHLLQTAFQFIDLEDGIRFWRRPSGVVELLRPLPGVPPESDLAIRAARRLAAGHSDLPGVAIEVDKRLPMQGGVGGGSSDAATVLVALNRLWGLGHGPGTLARFGLELGADVPVFVLGQAAWGEGVGELLTPLDFPERHYLLLQPDARIATAEVFQAPELTRDSPAIKITDFLAGRSRNDCEPVVRRRFPEVAAALDWLGRFGPARLTGTGACVFAEVRDAAAAREALEQVPARWRAWSVTGRNRSPLAARELLEAPGTEAAR